METHIVSRVPRTPTSRPPLLFVHGAFAGAWCWEEHFLDWFAELGFEAHALDLPGRFGRPDAGMLQSYTLFDYLDAVLAAIDGMPVPPIVIGHSMGGYLAWRATELRDVAGMVLMAPVPPTGLAAPAMQLMIANPSLFADVARVHAGEPGDPDRLHAALFSDNMPKSRARRHMARFQSESRLAVAGLYVGHMPNVLALWGTPVKIVGAQHDTLIPPAHVHWTASLAGTSAHIYEKMGHGMMLEPGWETVAADIGDWIAEVLGR